MSEVFIVYRPYKHLSPTESLLMSWIISLNDNQRTICFSNEYAGNMLNVSDRTIRSAISKLKSLGFINTFITREKRIIYLVRKPEVKDVSVEVCDILGEENTSIQGGKNNLPDRKELPSRQETISVREEISSTYNKEYNKDNNDTTPCDTDLRFNKIVQLFPKGKQIGIQEAYDYVWQFLKEEDKKTIEKILPVYIQRNKETPNYIKPINKYFNEQYWNSDTISLTLLNKPKKVEKKFKF